LPLTIKNPLHHNTCDDLTGITNALSKTTTITVNPAGQPLTITDPLSNVTTLTYEVGDLIKVKTH